MKRDVIHTELGMHVTAKGTSYPFDRLQRFGTAICMEREFRNHPTVRYLQAYLLPEQGWQVCKYTPHQGAHWCDWYVDICRIEEQEGNYVVTDLYLDVGVHEGKGYDLLDCDELGEALGDGHITVEMARGALDSLQRLCEALAQHNYRMERLLATCLNRGQAESAASQFLPEKGKGAVGRRG